MLRSHRGLLAAGLAVAFALSTTAAFAQGPDNQGGRRGQGGPGGFGGGPGGFGGGPGGFGGGPGGFGGGPGGFGGRGGRTPNPTDSIPMLLGIDVVQAELKLTDEQKGKIQAINDKANTQRTALFEKMRGNRGNRGNRGGNNNAGNNDNNNDNGNVDREAVFAELTALQKDTESALAKVLTKEQGTRVLQISYQLAGVQAFRSPALVQKLKLDEGQIDQIDQILDEVRDSQLAMFRTAFANANGGNNGDNGGRTRGGNAEGGRTRGGNAEGDRTRGGNAEGGNNRGGNAEAGRNRGGNAEGGNNDDNGGRRNRPDFNDPAFQARMAEARTQTNALNEKAMVAIARVLKKGQKDVYKNLVGAKFEHLDKVQQRRRGGPGGPNTPPATAAAPTTPAATTPSATGAATKSATRPQSLSERRRAASAPK